jgi:hypothetical protein
MRYRIYSREGNRAWKRLTSTITAPNTIEAKKKLESRAIGWLKNPVNYQYNATYLYKSEHTGPFSLKVKRSRENTASYKIKEYKLEFWPE